MKKIKISAIVGPTASGKSALAVEVAKCLGGEIVSCDSMQIYRDMSIGTAKPTPGEMGVVPHHLIDFQDPRVPFSCADYEKMAREKIDEITVRGHLPIFCGGTGLYLDAVLRGSGFPESASDPTVRERLNRLAGEIGADALYERLRAVDPDAAAATHPNNLKRVIRALEVYETTGRTKTALDRESLEAESPYDATVIGLRYRNRQTLYDRIDARVLKMVDGGLVAETKRLLDDGIFEANATAAQAIGYKELLGYLRGEKTLDAAIADLQIATRHYAKRQMTWFSAKSYVRWLDLDAEDGKTVPSFEEIVNNAVKLFS